MVSSTIYPLFLSTLILIGEPAWSQLSPWAWRIFKSAQMPKQKRRNLVRPNLMYALCFRGGPCFSYLATTVGNPHKIGRPFPTARSVDVTPIPETIEQPHSPLPARRSSVSTSSPPDTLDSFFGNKAGRRTAEGTTRGYGR